jgi:hypothetical protein
MAKLNNRQKVIHLLRNDKVTNALKTLSSTSKESHAGVIDSDAYSEEPTINDMAAIKSAAANANKSIDDYNSNIALASEPEIQEILDVLIDEMVVYAHKSAYFAEPDYALLRELKFKESDINTLDARIREEFATIYNMLNFNGLALRHDIDSIDMVLKTWFATGKVMWEIIYDDINAPTKIIDIKRIDLRIYNATYANKQVKSTKNNTYTTVYFWNITPKSTAQQIIPTQHTKHKQLLDSQVICIDWSNTDITKPTSYVSSLLRPFRLLRLYERVKVGYAVMNSRFRLKYVIPVKGKGKIKAEQTLRTAMNQYKENVTFDDSTAEVSVNGSPDIPFTSELWFAETSSGTPSIDTLGSEGPDLSSNDNIATAYKKLQKQSRIPMTRFEEDGMGFWNNDATSIARDERRFSKLISRWQAMFAIVIIKPLYITLALKYPEYSNDVQLQNYLKLKFNAYNPFALMMEMELKEKQLETIDTMYSALVEEDDDGNEIRYFAKQYLVEKYLDWSISDTKRNAELLKQEQEKTKTK